MSWFSLSANETEAAKDRYCLFIAVDFDFPSGHRRLWSGSGDIAIGGNTYEGMAGLARVNYPEETSQLTAARKSYQLSGAAVDPALVPESDIDGSFGRSVVEYVGFLNFETRALLAEPEINWEGEISDVSRVDGAEPSITVNAEHRLFLLDQVDGWRGTHEHQQEFYPGDKGFDQLAASENKELLWGGQRVPLGGLTRSDGGSRQVTTK